jgi:SET domain-containing protein
MRTRSTDRSDRRAIEVRGSTIHGRGVFARLPIRSGTTVVEYKGERLDPDEAAERYDDSVAGSITLLFTVDDRRVIDGGRGGNEARFINHSCEPNCESYVHRGRVFIRAVRNIKAGEELTYSYDLLVGGRPLKAWAKRYRCRCSALTCRRTMLEPSLARQVRRLLNGSARVVARDLYPSSSG